MRPLVYDLFCGAGGAAKGYHDAGFDVVGFDLDDRMLRQYPYECHKEDAFNVLAAVPNLERLPDLIHASPVCKGYSVASISQRQAGTHEYPDQLPEIRDGLDFLYEEYGIPYVIENVPGSPMRDYVTLCGSQFGLTVDVGDVKLGLRRHRQFEAMGFKIPDAGPHDHSLRAISVTGHGQPSWVRRKGDTPIRVAHWREVMGIDWMSRDCLSQAIPPAYTEWIGSAFMASSMEEARAA